MQTDVQYSVAEDFQRLVTACEQMKKRLHTEQEQSQRLEVECNRLLERNDSLNGQLKSDTETISNQRKEIGQ